MNWYLVKLVFQIICGKGEHKAQFEEQIRLIQASNPQAAISKANELVEKEAHPFLNQSEQFVHWQLIAITDIYSFETGIDGASIFSTISEEDQPIFYIQSAQMRSKDVWNRCVEMVHQ